MQTPRNIHRHAAAISVSERNSRKEPAGVGGRFDQLHGAVNNNREEKEEEEEEVPPYQCC